MFNMIRPSKVFVGISRGCSFLFFNSNSSFFTLAIAGRYTASFFCNAAMRFPFPFFLFSVKRDFLTLSGRDGDLSSALLIQKVADGVGRQYKFQVSIGSICANIPSENWFIQSL